MLSMDCKFIWWNQINTIVEMFVTSLVSSLLSSDFYLSCKKKEAKYIVSKPWKIFFKIKNKRLINGFGTILSDSLNNFVVRTNSSNKNVCLFILRHFIWLCFLIQVNCTKALRNLSKAYLWIVYQYWLLTAT